MARNDRAAVALAKSVLARPIGWLSWDCPAELCHHVLASLTKVSDKLRHRHIRQVRTNRVRTFAPLRTLYARIRNHYLRGATLIRTRTFPRWRRNGIYLGVAATLAALGLVASATPALAHANIITGTSTCSTTAGADYQITWTVANDWNLPETANVTYATGGNDTLSQASLTIPASGDGTGGTGQLPYQSITVVQTLPQSVTGTIVLDVSSTYSDSYSTSNSGEITAPTNCPPPSPTTTTVPAPAPVAPAPASPTTIPAVVPSVAPTTTILTPPPTKKIRVAARSTKRPTVSASALPTAKPHVPIIKAATFTG